MIPVAAPVLNGNERRYVLETLAANQLSSGRFVARFEHAWADYCGVRHAIATTSGTTALHLALLGLGLRPGDEVIVPATTYIATANAVRYGGALPVFVDVDPQTWCLDARQIAPRVTARTVGIIAVHLYGQPADLGALGAFARQHGLWLLEDAAEAHGATYRGHRVGSLGDAGIFSFYGNKILTCGEGGMVMTNNATTASRIRHYAATCQTAPGRYEHDGVGYNYRLTDLQAAVGLAQVERVAWHLERRAQFVRQYRRHLAATVGFQMGGHGATEPAHWTMPVLLPPEGPGPAEVASRMRTFGVETRPIFAPLPQQRPYAETRAYPEAERLAQRGLLLPLHAGMTDADVDAVCAALAHVLARTAVAV